MWSKESAASYLAGIIDGEGYIRKPGKNGWNRGVIISNTDQDIVDASCEALDVLGIPYRVYSAKVYKENHKACTHISIYGRESMEMVRDLVPIRCGYKQDSLRVVIEIAQGRRDPIGIRNRLTHEALTEAYQTMTMKQMADHFGVSLHAIINAMNRHGIQRVGGADRARRVWKSRRDNANARSLGT